MGLFGHSKKQSPERRRNNEPRPERDSAIGLEQRYNFRRNQTLTGSSSSRVVSASEHSAQLKSPRVQAHELSRKRRALGGLLCILGLAALGTYLLIDQFTASVHLRASGIATQLDGRYADTIQAYLAQHPSERLRFLTNRAALSSYVSQHHPEIESLAMGGSDGIGVSSVSLTLRRPLAGWSIQDRQQYVDASGTAFGRNYYPAPAVQIVDKSGAPLQSGQAIASNRFLGFVGRVVGLAKTQGYTVTQVAIPLLTNRQIEIQLEGAPYSVKFSIDRPAGEQVEDMARAERWFRQRGITPQYIDVRVGGRAFYR